MIWKVSESQFLGNDSNLKWTGRIQEVNQQGNTGKWHVTVFYGSKAQHNLPEIMNYGKNLARFDFKLNNSVRSYCGLYKGKIYSAEAVYPPPRRFQYGIVLVVGDRLIIESVQTLIIRDSLDLEDTDKTGEKMLEPDFKLLCDALRTNNKTAIMNSDAVKMARWLISCKNKIAEPEERLIFSSITARVNGSKTVLKPRQIPLEGTVFHLPARVGNTVILESTIIVNSRIPYYEQVKTTEKPLPSFSFIKLEHNTGRLLLYGTPSETDHQKIGPFRVTHLQRLILHAGYPFFPPGEKPSVTAKILFRFGRPIETYLDQKKMPPFPKIPKDLNIENLIYEVVRHVTSAINPDTATIPGLKTSELSYLKTFAAEEIRDFPELEKMIKHITIGPLRFNGIKISTEPGWTEQDATHTLKNPSNADILAKKIESDLHPKIEVVYSKAGPAVLEEPEGPEKEDAITAYAIAAAALSSADAKKYKNHTANLVNHLVKIVKPDSVEKWPLDRIVKTGQGLKLTAIHCADTSLKKQADGLALILKKEAFRRFVTKSGSMNLHWKVKAAHLISSEWLPYSTKNNSLESGSGIKKEPLLEQRIASPSGEDLTGEILEEIRLRYKAALKRADEYLKISGMSIHEQKSWMENFLDQWHGYLFQSHKGGMLQPYEPELTLDRKNALKKIENRF